MVIACRYAVDALRQLASKLLVRGGGGAAAQHVVQTSLKEALKPFVTLIATSKAIQVRLRNISFISKIKRF